jgi:predicted ATPase
LLAAFDGVVKSGKPKLILVCGFSGISKTSITSELHKIIVMRRGLFVEFEARF